MRGWKIWVEPSGKVSRCRWSGIYGTGQKVFIYKADAQEFAKAKRQDLQRMDAGLPPVLRVADALTVGQYAKTYLGHSEREKSPRTFRNFDKPAIESLVLTHGQLALAALNSDHIKEWKYITEKRYGGTTASMHFRAVRTFLNSAVKARHITESPARHVVGPAEGPGGRALTDDEIKSLLDGAPEALYRAAVFALNTMLRIDEVCKFDWSWVRELPGGEWMGKIPANIRKTRGKVAGDCVFPINAAARAVMGNRGTGRVFPHPPVTLQHQLVRVRVAKNLPADVTFHCFRHTGASRYLKAGGHMEDLLKSRMWSDPRSLLRYVHIEEKTLFDRFAQIQLPPVLPKAEKPPTQG